MTTFIPLFTTSRVIQAVYRIILTLWLLYHLIKRIHGREIPRNRRPTFGGRRDSWLVEGQD